MPRENNSKKKKLRWKRSWGKKGRSWGKKGRSRRRSKI